MRSLHQCREVAGQCTWDTNLDPPLAQGGRSVQERSGCGPMRFSHKTSRLLDSCHISVKCWGKRLDVVLNESAILLILQGWQSTRGRATCARRSAPKTNISFEPPRLPRSLVSEERKACSQVGEPWSLWRGQTPLGPPDEHLRLTDGEALQLPM